MSLTLVVKQKDKRERIEERMFKPTSKKDILYMLGGRVNVVTYNQIQNYETLEDLLNPYQTVVILYPNPSDDPEIEAEVGHWTCLFVMPRSNVLQYFDSYGVYMDEKVGEYNEEDEGVKLHKRTPMEPALLKLILESKYADSTCFNNTQYQSMTLNVATCGLWCVSRIKNNNMMEEEYEMLALDGPLNCGVRPDFALSCAIINEYPAMG